MGPASTIVAVAATERTVVTVDGTRLTFRRMNALDKLRLFKAAGALLAQNEPWLGMALLASSVTAINDVPVPAPTTEQQIEAVVARLGDSGIAAIAAALHADTPIGHAELVASAGN